MGGPHARDVGAVLLVLPVGQVVGLEVPVDVADQPPEHGEDRPGDQEAHGEGQGDVPET